MKKSLKNSILAISAVALTIGATGCKGKSAAADEEKKEQLYAVNT